MNDIRLLRANEIECRVGKQDKQGKWITLLLYKDARVDYKILDEVFTPMGWQAEYESIDGKMYCTLSVWDESKHQWIRKQNVGTESNMEATKGEASDALKRAAFALGIGRELYTAPVIRITLESGESNYTKFSVREIGYDDDRNINRLVITDLYGKPRYHYGTQHIINLLSKIDSRQQMQSAWKTLTLWHSVPEVLKAFEELGTKFPRTIKMDINK